MALEPYRRKRNFRVTPEPKGRVAPRRQRGLHFVVQQHAARRLHYDFRLELDGVLLSWAVPKGPSLDPQVKRLAMHVEDHPVEYGDFEGVIPPKQYGAGSVLLWDRGEWRPRGDPRAGYRQGKLKFELAGEKLRGGWTLVKRRGGAYGDDGGDPWLLIKERDGEARPGSADEVVDRHPESVASGRVLEEVAAEADRVWRSDRPVAENVEAAATGRRARRRLQPGRAPGARRAPVPDFIAPQLATLVKAPPEGEEWLHEMKLDGYRMLCRVADGKARMLSRNGRDWTAKFPGLARALARLPVRAAWVDGEVVAPQPDGRTSFQALQNYVSGGSPHPLAFFAFDLPYLDGYDLRRVPLVERKRLLGRLLEGTRGPLHFSSHVQGAGQAFYEAACRRRLEGIVSKRADAPYVSRRGRDWLKVKCAMRQELVIGGYTDPEGSRAGLGALLLGVYDDGALRYAGKVGTGFSAATLRALRRRLEPLTRATPPFADPPTGAEGRRVHWVAPRLVAEVAFTEWTRDGTLRHAAFLGLRADRNPREVVREAPAEPAPPKRGRRPARRAEHGEDVAFGPVRLTHPDKPLYPESGITKRDLAEYYRAVSRWILPHLAERPLSLVRCPDGWGKCFFQKNAGARVDPTIERVTVRTSEGPARYMMANSADALVALVQMGVLEIHPWGSTRHALDRPDRIVFDIDPDDAVDWSALADAAREVNALLGSLGLRGFVKTTGGKGLHVVVPIAPERPWDEIKGFSKAVADLFARTFPERFTSKLSKARRSGRLFIDYLRNAEGATAICAWSTRARARAPVAMPLAWSELGRIDLRFDHFNLGNAPAHLRADPWGGFFRLRQPVSEAMMKKVGYAPGRRS